MERLNNELGRREFLKRAAKTAVIGVAATNLAGSAVPKDKQIKLTEALL